ncbi:hypothetical protein LguiB_017593 [Lonicera macranthoides]
MYGPSFNRYEGTRKYIKAGSETGIDLPGQVAGIPLFHLLLCVDNSYRVSLYPISRCKRVRSESPVFILQFLGFLLFDGFLGSQALLIRRTFVVNETPYTRLCSTKNILTVNGQYPGPTLFAHRGDTIIVDVHNKGSQNVTLHWYIYIYIYLN